MPITSKTPDQTGDEVFYPETDGQPMGETEWHVCAIFQIFEVLRYHFRRKQVYVAADMFLYYRRGDPSACVAPDIMLIKDIPKHRRKTFKLWQEKAVPCVVIEVTSETTFENDLGEKYQRYLDLGVSEYFLFDPMGEALTPPLQGFRRRGSRYVPIRAEADGSLLCKELGLRMSLEAEWLRFRDAKTGKRLLTGAERADRTEQRARRAEQRVERERLRVEQERQRVEQAEQRIEQERQRADALAEEVERLRAEIARQKAD